MTRLRYVLASLAAIFAFAAAGCGGDDETTDSAGTAETIETTATTETAETTEPTGEPAVSNEIDVSMTEYAMAPSNVLPPDPDGGPPTSKAKTGEVTFHVTNDGAETHSFVFNISGQETAIDGDLAPGESADLTVDVPTGGFYEYYCPIGTHQDQGMQGQLEVE